MVGCKTTAKILTQCRHQIILITSLMPGPILYHIFDIPKTSLNSGGGYSLSILKINMRTSPPSFGIQLIPRTHNQIRNLRNLIQYLHFSFAKFISLTANIAHTASRPKNTSRLDAMPFHLAQTNHSRPRRVISTPKKAAFHLKNHE